MKMTLEKLKKLLDDPQYQDLTVDLARSNSSGRQWWAVMDSIVEQGANNAIWETTQWIALILETYPDAIDSVRVNFDTEYDGDDTYLTSTVFINGSHCFDGHIELNDEVLDACEKVDGMETLEDAVAALDEAGDSNLLSRVGYLKSAFDQDFTCVKQARKTGEDHAPDHHAFFVRKMLGDIANDAKQEAPSVARKPKV